MATGETQASTAGSSPGNARSSGIEHVSLSQCNGPRHANFPHDTITGPAGGICRKRPGRRRVAGDDIFDDLPKFASVTGKGGVRRASPACATAVDG